MIANLAKQLKSTASANTIESSAASPPRLEQDVSVNQKFGGRVHSDVPKAEVLAHMCGGTFGRSLSM